MKPSFAVLPLVYLLSIPALAHAHAATGQVELNTDSEFQRKTVTYNCGAEGPLEVTYVNADPNYLAIMPITGVSQHLVFSAILSGSGTRYAAGKWQWWSTGNAASLHDTTLGDNAAPALSCTEINAS